MALVTRGLGSLNQVTRGLGDFGAGTDVWDGIKPGPDLAGTTREQWLAVAPNAPRFQRRRKRRLRGGG